jgi:hypothetical protein
MAIMLMNQRKGVSMPMLRHLSTASGLLAVVAVGAFAASAEESANEGAWRILLRQQLKAEKNCDLNEVLMYHELPLGDTVALDGRTSCIDGREFNFSRKRPHQKFDIQICQPAVC